MLLYSEKTPNHISVLLPVKFKKQKPKNLKGAKGTAEWKNIIFLTGPLLGTASCWTKIVHTICLHVNKDLERCHLLL